MLRKDLLRRSFTHLALTRQSRVTLLAGRVTFGAVAAPDSREWQHVPFSIFRPLSKPSTANSSIMEDTTLHHFHDASAMDSFLSANQGKLDSFIIKFAKKGSGIPSVTREEAIDVALCYGWIDGVGRSIDANWHTTRFTPRRAKSMWSQKNVDAVARLTAAGRMRAGGHAAVDAAKADGRWERAYPRPSDIMEPPDFEEALAQKPEAVTFYKTLNRSQRYSVLWRILTASPTARPGRVSAMVSLLEEGKAPNALGGKKKTAKEAEGKKAEKKGPTKVVKKSAAPRKATTAKPGKPAASSSKPKTQRTASGPATQPSRRPGLRPRA